MESEDRHGGTPSCGWRTSQRRREFLDAPRTAWPGVPGTSEQLLRCACPFSCVRVRSNLRVPISLYAPARSPAMRLIKCSRSAKIVGPATASTKIPGLSTILSMHRGVERSAGSVEPGHPGKRRPHPEKVFHTLLLYVQDPGTKTAPLPLTVSAWWASSRGNSGGRLYPSSCGSRKTPVSTPQPGNGCARPCADHRREPSG